MIKEAVSSGTIHNLPDDLCKGLLSSPGALEKWQSLTPLARNEWICWTTSVKQQKTRDEHIQRVVEELNQGKRRPCCWAGCLHRTDRPLSPTKQWLLSKQSKPNTKDGL